MKKSTTHYRWAAFLLLFLAFGAGLPAWSQIVISTNHTASNGNALVTFNVQNTTANAVILTGVSTHLNTATVNNVELLYRTTPINQPGTWTDGTVGAGQNGWISAGTATLNNTNNTNGVVPVLSGLSVIIPAGSTYGFALGATSVRYMDLGSGVNTFSSSGINLLTGDGISWGGTIPPATPSNYPRGFVGSIELIPGTPCNGQPAQGTTTGPAALCPAQSGNFSVSGATLAGSIFYQWQSSPNGIVWSNIPGANSFGYATTISASVNLRRMDVCTATNDTVYSTPHFVSLNPFFNCYCVSGATSSANIDIGQVEIAGLNYNSSAVTGNCEQYSDFTNLPATPLFINVNNNVKITTTDCEGSSFSNRAVSVFIDYNQDGDFNGPGERVFGTPVATGALTVEHTGNFSVPVGTPTGITRMRVISSTVTGLTQSPCGTYTNGETEDYLVNIQPQPADEVALVSIDSPLQSSCLFPNAITVTVKNNGTNPISSLTFDVNSGGLPTNNILWNGTIAPGATQQLQIPGLFAFNDGDTLGVTVKLPNGTTDIAVDNSAGFRHYLSLSGEYTVGYGTTNLATKEFADIVTAVQNVYQRGVCDTVYLNIRDDIYQARFLLQGDYFDYNPGEMVVFRSETKNASTLVIRETSASTADNYLVRLDNTHGWGFEHITFQPQGTTYRSAIDIIGNSGDIFVDSCRFIGDVSTTGMTSMTANASAIKTASSSSQNNISVSYSYFQDFAVAGYFYGGSTSNYESGIVFDNNELVKIHAAGFYGYYLNRPFIRNNRIVMDTIPGGGATTQYGIYYNYINGGAISGNHFISNDVTYTMYLYDVQGDSDPFLVANNFIYNSYTGGNTAAVRSAASANNRIDFIHNSISQQSNSTSYAVLDLGLGKNMRLINNIIASQGSAALIEAPSSVSLNYSNHNNWYHPTSSLGNMAGTIYSDLSALQSGSSFDGASVSVDPLFNNEDLHTCVAALDAAGESTALTRDFDGDVRNGITPDIGADEFIGPNDALLTGGDFFEKCPSQAVSFGAAEYSGITYTWVPGNLNTPTISVTAPGQYILSAIGACGTFTDTVTVNDIAAPVASFNTGATVSLAVEFINGSSNAIGYLWNFGDGSTSANVNPTHIYENGDVYVVTLTVYGECDTVSTSQTVTVVASGLAELEGGNITLYPNPATDQLQLSYSAGLNGNVQTDILDMSGKTVHSSAYALSSGATQSIDVSALKPGVYHIRIRLNDTQKVMRFVKK